MRPITECISYKSGITCMGAPGDRAISYGNVAIQWTGLSYDVYHIDLEMVRLCWDDSVDHIPPRTPGPGGTICS